MIGTSRIEAIEQVKDARTGTTDTIVDPLREAIIRSALSDLSVAELEDELLGLNKSIQMVDQSDARQAVKRIIRAELRGRR